MATFYVDFIVFTSSERKLKKKIILGLYKRLDATPIFLIKFSLVSPFQSSTEIISIFPSWGPKISHLMGIPEKIIGRSDL